MFSARFFFIPSHINLPVYTTSDSVQVMINKCGIELNDDIAPQLYQKTYINVIAKIKLLLTMIDCEICNICTNTKQIRI